MKNDFESCTGVLLMADQTGPSHPTLFGRKGLDGHALLGKPSKKTPMQDFFIMFYYIICTKNQKIGDLFCPIIISRLLHCATAVRCEEF